MLLCPAPCLCIIGLREKVLSARCIAALDLVVVKGEKRSDIGPPRSIGEQDAAMYDAQTESNVQGRAQIAFVLKMPLTQTVEKQVDKVSVLYRAIAFLGAKQARCKAVFIRLCKRRMTNVH